MAVYTLPKNLHPDFAVKGRKPVGAVEIDWSMSITRGLVGLWLMDGSDGFTRDYTGNNHGKNAGLTAINHTVGPHGKEANQVDVTSTSRIDLGSIDLNNPLSCHRNNEISCYAFAYFDADNTQEFGRFVEKNSGGVGAGGWTFACYNSGTGDGQSDFYVAGSNKSSGAAMPDKEYSGFGFSMDGNSGDLRYYLNGQLDYSANSTFTIPTTTANACLMNWNTSSDRGWGNGMVYVGVWDRVLTDVEQEVLHKDRYHFLKPAVPMSYFTAGAAGGLSIPQIMHNRRMQQG